MNAKEILAKLKSLGTAQTRKTYGRHGVTGPMFGVKYGDLGKIVRAVKVDHDAAVSLWESGNHDARIVATKIVDPERCTAKLLNAWIRCVDNHVLSAAVAGVVAKSQAGHKMLTKLLDAKAEWRAAVGWSALSDVVKDGGPFSAAEYRSLLRTIAKRIHGSPNRTKYSMNNALIAIGSYVPGMEDAAVETAERIGPVEVDHGLTDCQTPLAAPYIRKAAAHHRQKLAKAATKKKATRKKSPPKRASTKKAAARRGSR